jgi:antitoxin component YwqK of YwqJK toxin-antitoxin module
LPKNYIMKIAHSIFILLVSYFTFSQKTVNETQLTKSESKLFLQKELYSGMVVNRFANNQVKSIYQVNQGLVKGKMIEYLFDIEFKYYQDTAELNKLNFQLTTKSNELEAIIQDSINANKLAMDYLNYEIGGNEKWIDLEIKNKEGKLKSKKKEIFDKYEQLVQSKNSADRILSYKRKAIREVNQEINYVTQKPFFIGKKSKEFEQVNFIAEGNAIIYDSLGNKFGEGNFIKGLQNGAWVYYFNTGEKMADVNYLNGNGGDLGKTGIPKNGREGIFNSYYKNGNPEAINPYKSDKLNGLCTFYYENGNKSEVSNYTAGELDGVYNSFYENSKPKEVSNYKVGVRDGLYTSFFENGNKVEVSNYKAGKLDGLCTFYYENGKLKEVSNYKAGKLEGLETEYNNLGLKEGEINYSDGRLNGKSTFYEKGVKITELQYINGKIHGPFVYYFENGKIYRKGMIDSTYLQNKGIKEDLEYNEDGSIKAHKFFNKDGTEKKPKVALNSAELNKSYKCKCCKATINGIKNGYSADGSECSTLTVEYMKQYHLLELEFSKALGFSNIYDYYRDGYKYCTLKCARTCY